MLAIEKIDTENKAKFVSSVLVTSYIFLGFVLILLYFSKHLIISYYGGGRIEDLKNKAG